MQRVIFPALLIPMMLLSSLGKAQDGPSFDKVVPTDAINFVVNNSTDGTASTMLFDNFFVETNSGPPTEPDTNIRTFTYVRRIESTTDSCVVQDFRGYVSRDVGASATMIVHSGGQTTVVDLRKAIEEARKNLVNREDPTRKKAQQAADEEGFTDNDPPGEDDDFFVRIATPVSKGRSLQTTVILLVDRLGGEDEPLALIVIDSIDSTIRAMATK